MPKAYRVLAEKYEALSQGEILEAYTGNPYYSREEYIAFIKSAMEADTYGKFAKLCKNFIHKPTGVLTQFVEMRVNKALLEELVSDDEVISKVPALPNSPTEIKYNSAADYLNNALGYTLTSFTRQLYAPERSIYDQEKGEVLWNAWHKAYTDYKKAGEQMKKAEDEAKIKLDI